MHGKQGVNQESQGENKPVGKNRKPTSPSPPTVPCAHRSPLISPLACVPTAQPCSQGSPAPWLLGDAVCAFPVWGRGKAWEVGKRGSSGMGQSVGLGQPQPHGSALVPCSGRDRTPRGSPERRTALGPFGQGPAPSSTAGTTGSLEPWDWRGWRCQSRRGREPGRSVRQEEERARNRGAAENAAAPARAVLK